MTPELIARYQPGGDLYAAVRDEFGMAVATDVALAAKQNDNAALNRVLSNARATIRTGTIVTDASYDMRGTLALIGDQLTSDPLGAPLDAANRQLSKLAGNTLLAFLRNPMVLLVLLAIGAVVWVNFFGVPRWVKR